MNRLHELAAVVAANAIEDAIEIGNTTVSSSQAKRVLKLHGAAIENGDESTLQVLPPSVEDEEEVVSRLENPAEAALKAEDGRGAIVLDQVRPADIGRKTVVHAELEKLSGELPLVEYDLVAVASNLHAHVRTRLQREADLELLSILFPEKKLPHQSESSATQGRRLAVEISARYLVHL